MSNMRAAGKDENVVCSPVKEITLEAAINFIGDDELVEVTPKSIRIRKTVLDAAKRHFIAARLKKMHTK